MWGDRVKRPAASRAMVPMPPLSAVHHMTQKVRALSYRVPLLVRVGNRGFTFSISGWNGAV